MALTHSLIDSLVATEVLDNRRLHFFDKGSNIPLGGEGAWQVHNGIVQISELSLNGDEILLGWSQPATFFGLGLTLAQLETYQAKPLSEVYLRWYPVAEIQNSTKLSNLILSHTVRRLRQTETLLVIAGLKRVEQRLEELLKLLAQEMGQPIADGIRLSVRLTHQMLANAIGTTRVTVTRLLGELQTKGRVSFDGDRHLIIHPTVP